MSKYKIGWIGLRVVRIGRASKTLQALGWIYAGRHGEINNRNGFNWLRPSQTESDFQTADWKRLASHGLQATAVWFSDAQWGKMSGITEKQWLNRVWIDGGKA